MSFLEGTGDVAVVGRVLRRSRSRLPIESAQRFNLAARMERASSGTLGPWYGRRVRRRFLAGGLGREDEGGEGGRLRVAVASKREMMRALWSWMRVGVLRMAFVVSSNSVRDVRPDTKVLRESK